MNQLTIIKQGGCGYIDSREVAEAIGKRHDHLLRDIAGYLKTMGKITAPNFGVSDFYLKSSYKDSSGRTLPCYLISKMGCELIANKLIGEKGILFTCAYVTKFNEMERRERAKLEALCTIPRPRLGEINACVRIIVRGLKYLGAPPENILNFLKSAYAPFGIDIVINAEENPGPRWYRAGDIAKECGIYSIYGKPHSQAVACILNEIIFIGAEHKRLETEPYGDNIGMSIRYDEYALSAVNNWIADYGYPDDIYGFDRTYHVEY